MLSDLKLMDIEDLPPVRGRYTENAPLGQVGWFRTGGTAEVLFKPADREDLIEFLQACPAHIPVTTLGVLSNTIIRDAGVPGVVIRMGREFTDIEQDGDLLTVGAAALDMNVALKSAELGLAGLEFLSGIPGSIGGALRMNAGAYGTETKDVLVKATYVDRAGQIFHETPEEMGMSYRHSDAPYDAIFLEGLFKAEQGETTKIEARIAEIKARRAETQPIKSKTGGSTFANPTDTELEAADQPAGTKVWQLIDSVGGRGLMVGGAQMSELHCNFMINVNEATAQDLENLGEEIRKRVYETHGIALRWEIRRIGMPGREHNKLLQ